MAESSKSTSRVDRAWGVSDPVAAAVGYVVTILAVFGVFKNLGLDPDQVATLGGALGGLVATLRALHERSKKRQITSLLEELERHRASSSHSGSSPK
jgi:hypothetical protein